MLYKYLDFLDRNKDCILPKLMSSTEETIFKVENALKIKFPEAVREFFLIGGGGRYDIFWYGIDFSNYTLETLPLMINEVKDELDQLHNFKKDDTFYNYHLPILNESEVYDFVMLNEGDDPSVYRFSFELFAEWDNVSEKDLDNWLLRTFNGLPLSKFRGALKLSNNFSEYVRKRMQVNIHLQ